MNIFRDKMYSVIDIGLIKWSCILFGMVVGAYFSDFTLKYFWVFIVVAFLLAIKPIFSYFKELCLNVDQSEIDHD